VDTLHLFLYLGGNTASLSSSKLRCELSVFYRGPLSEDNLFNSYFFVVLRFELRVSHLLGRHSTTWQLCQPSFVLGIFEIGSCFCCPGWLWTTILLIYASQVARITEMSHQCWPIPTFWVFLFFLNHERILDFFQILFLYIYWDYYVFFCSLLI
jgi:hypothetical protein